MKVNKHGVVYYSPIYNWSHVDVMAYIENFNIKCHLYTDGLTDFKWGPAGPWAAREHTGSMQKGWEEVYNINPLIVKKAVRHITSVAKFLENSK